jgi:hypothetical protein
MGARNHLQLEMPLIFPVLYSTNGVEAGDDTGPLLTGCHGDNGLGLLQRDCSRTYGQVWNYFLTFVCTDQTRNTKGRNLDITVVVALFPVL